MSTVDAVRLRAEPVKIPVEGGEGDLRFSLLALSILEADFGSLGVALGSLHVARNGTDEERLGVKMATIAGRFLRAGFSTPEREWTLAEALAAVECGPADALDLCQIAIGRAFPKPDGPGNGEAAAGSTGGPSTTPPPSDGAAATVSSG